MSKSLRSRVTKVLASAILLTQNGVNLMPFDSNTVYAMKNEL